MPNTLSITFFNTLSNTLSNTLYEYVPLSNTPAASASLCYIEYFIDFFVDYFID